MGIRRPIAVATVDGALETGEHGEFTLTLPPGPRCVKVRAAGFVDAEFCEDLLEGQQLRVVYALRPRDLNPYETVVRADKARTEVSRTTVRKEELAQVAGTMGDPLRAIMLMPGVGSVFSGVAYPVVRGSEPAGTGYYLDGVPVPLLFHLFVGPSVVHPDFIDSLDFYAGAPPPKYGRLMGGAVDAKTTQPRHEGVRASVTLDLLNAGAFVEVPIERTGTDVTLAGRFSFAPWLFSLIANASRGLVPGQGDSKVVLAYYDYQARVDQQLAAGKLRLFVFGSSDDYGIGPVSPTAGWLLRAQFHRADLRYRHPLGPGELEVGLTAGIDVLGFYGPNPSGTEVIPGVGTVRVSTHGESVTELSLRGRAGWTGRLARTLELRAGAEVDRRQSDLTVTQTLTHPRSGLSLTRDLALPASVGTLFGAWTQLVWEPSPRWTLSPGLRFDSYHLVPGIQFFAVEPRLTGQHALTDAITLKAAVGLFHQPPAALINLPIVDIGGLRFGLQEGLQTDLGVEWKPTRWIELGVDVYFNPMFHTIDLSVFGEGALGFQIRAPKNGDPFPGVSAIDSHGYATGLELMVRHPMGDRWFGWLSYSLQRSVRATTYQVVDPSTGEVTGFATGDLAAGFDQTHVLNATLSYALPRGWTAGASVHVNSGRPESGNLTSWTQLPGENPPRWFDADAAHLDRLPPFFRLDVRIAKQWLFNAFVLDTYLDVMNATASTEVVSYTYGFVAGRRVKTPTGVPAIVPVLGAKATY